jgi:hypothetical protein
VGDKGVEKREANMCLVIHILNWEWCLRGNQDEESEVK